MTPDPDRHGQPRAGIEPPDTRLGSAPQPAADANPVSVVNRPAQPDGAIGKAVARLYADDPGLCVAIDREPAGQAIPVQPGGREERPCIAPLRADRDPALDRNE